jgi:hypothetical protein
VAHHTAIVTDNEQDRVDRPANHKQREQLAVQAANLLLLLAQQLQTEEHEKMRWNNIPYSSQWLVILRRYKHTSKPHLEHLLALHIQRVANAEKEEEADDKPGIAPAHRLARKRR